MNSNDMELLRRYVTERSESAFAELVRRHIDMVYSAAHHAFTYLVQQHGEQAVRAILHAMLPGPKFSEAFAQIIGVRPDDFAAQFKRYARAP